eukprot:10596141-Alexandrium_andersonii.AAC.1
MNNGASDGPANMRATRLERRRKAENSRAWPRLLSRSRLDNIREVDLTTPGAKVSFLFAR